MSNIIRRIVGILLVTQFGAMLGFDLWLWAGDVDFADPQLYSVKERAVIFGMMIAELAGVAFGLWLIFAKLRAAKGENHREK